MALHPELVAAVEARIGRTRIISAGRPLVGYYYDDPMSGGRRRLKIVNRGEEVLADCPFCNDSRGRLSINHRYGMRDAETLERGTNLWKCYNEECQKNVDNRAVLRGMLLPEIDLPVRGPVFRRPEVVRTDPRGLEPCEFNGILISVAELPESHKAITYLRDRKFDPLEMARTWDLGYAEHVPARTRGSMAQDRLIIPVHQHGMMIGWQARYIGEIDWKAQSVPKYLTYFPKSMALYGMDQCHDADVVVLVEGASDVWRYGPGAVCGFGKALSYDQARILANLLDGRPLILMPDTNDKDAFDKFCGGMRMVLDAGHWGPYGLAPLPRGVDPAKMTRPFLRNLVRQVAEVAKRAHEEQKNRSSNLETTGVS